MTALEARLLTWREEVNVLLRKSARHDYDQLDRTVYEVEARRLRDCADDLDAVLRAASPREVDIEELQADVWSHAEAHRLVKMERELEDPAAFFGYLREVLFKAARRPDYTVPPAPPREKTNEVDDVSGRGRDRVVGDHSAPVSAHARDMEVGTAETPADTERLPTAEEVRGILAEYRDAGADEVHELPATSGGETGRPAWPEPLPVSVWPERKAFQEGWLAANTMASTLTEQECWELSQTNARRSPDGDGQRSLG